MIKFHKSKGFSLVELMIVVAIMAILAAIAIPSFMKFSMKAKTAEASQNLSGIRTAEESYRAEEDGYLACGPYPNTVAAPPPASGTSWDATAAAASNFSAIGFAADGRVRYCYAVAIANASNTGPTFTATAVGDLDEKDGIATFWVSSASNSYPKVVNTTPGEY